jgi:hypothetical protein
MTTSPDLTATNELTELAFEQGRRLAGDPNIIGVGYGPKLRAGTPVTSDSLVFFVRQKIDGNAALAELATWKIPADIDGIPTDVIELGHLEVAAADRAPPVGTRGTRIDDPLIGGVATMGLGATVPGPAEYGTLGGQCFDKATAAPLVISNAHVWGRTLGVEVVQPVTPTALLGASAAPAVLGTPPMVVQTRVPSGLIAPVVFANAIGQAFLITGSESDPLPTGQAVTPVSASTTTISEQVIVSAPTAGLAPAGVRLSPTVRWDYQRLGTMAVLQTSTNAQRPVTKILTARRLFTNAASYSGSQTVNLYAEMIPAPGGAPAAAKEHFVLALLYPVATGDKFVPRVLRPTVRQSVTTVTASFAGFPAPARAGIVALPAFVGAFGVDAELAGTFAAPPAGSGLPAGTFVLRLPTGSVRVFVPIGTQVVLDISLTGTSGPLQAVALNSARDTVAATVTTAPGPSGRTLVTISASEIVEVVLTGTANAELFGVTSRRASPETAAPLAYTGSISASDLNPKGKWAGVLLVQAAQNGAPESANVVETAIGAATLINDCTFDVS